MKSIPISCPCPLKSKLNRVDDGYVCLEASCNHSIASDSFPVSGGIPILISESKCDTMASRENIKSYVSRPPRFLNSLKKLFFSHSNLSILNARIFQNEILKDSSSSKILIIGAASVGVGVDEFSNNPNFEIHGVDVFKTESVDLICDAHYLPLESDFYDGVWIQAVLEHVVEPSVVVQEIYRVLKLGGVVYAETAFMQQVHEGAFDFTRYTVLGHRFLFKKFQAISFGGIGGPSIVFAWAVRSLVWSISRSRNFGRFIGLVTQLIMLPLSLFVSKGSMYDASSGVFFMGRKVHGFQITHNDLIPLYKGQMH